MTDPRWNLAPWALLVLAIVGLGLAAWFPWLGLAMYTIGLLGAVLLAFGLGF